MTEHRQRYPGVSDHGLIGDLQTAALVAGDGIGATRDSWATSRRRSAICR